MAKSVGGIIIDIALHHDHVRMIQRETLEKASSLWTAETMLGVEEFNQMRHASAYGSSRLRSVSSLTPRGHRGVGKKHAEAQ